ncbi:terminase [Mesorhizobium sp. B2-2-4]|uniref:terminase large subunit n=1 Tax=unclassified Mesorhizobium TaxID=325217 RepID=UPI0011270C60|nr:MULTISPECIES: terminase TerL endonuclease subunit [unclassified Mesorhizobium]TPM59142.1 terminase [Mesorhizobium sp. B2-2-4]TPM67627.1 terminase [Mesorhizobium sp. B2-2-1]TPN66909.1 terminase [Mesorhizobium sp. B1-1-3]
MPISARPAADDLATLYACDVLDDKIVAGDLVKASCQRHLRDLDNGSSRGLTFNADKAKRIAGFFPSVLTITEGEKVGKPFQLLKWHGFVAASIFGWQRTDGLRRFRTAWMETGKGQAKSPLMAGVGLYMMGFDGKKRAECYAIAGDKDQAKVVFNDAAAMCRANMPDRNEDEFESLESSGRVIIRGTGDLAWMIEHPETGSKFLPLASTDAIAGPRPYFVAADEIHEMKTSHSIQTWKAAIDKMSGDPLMMLGTNTPGTNQIVGSEYSDLFTRVITGQVEDDSLFGVIYRVDKRDEETVFDNEAVWPKSMPALGETFPIENVRRKVATAKLMLSEALSTKRLVFGMRVGTEGFWVSEEAWNSCQGTVDETEMAGADCWLGLDLSKKNDLTALSATWRKDLKLHTKTWYFTVKKGIEDRARDDNAPYPEWVAAGLMEATPGATISYEFVAAKIQAICKVHNVKYLAFDPAKIDDFIDACERIDFEVWKYEGPDDPTGTGLMLVRHGQGTRIVFQERALCMPKSIERLEDAILNGDIVIDASPVTTMCAANAAIVADAMNNRAFDKKRSRGRIDGMVSIAESTGAATSEIQEEPVDFASIIANAMVV